MNRLFLHVGMHKTGTTALQQFFTLNRELLARRGFWYPDIGVPDHAPLAAALQEGNRQPLLDVIRLKESALHPSVLISSEDFIRQADALAFLREEVPAVTIVLFLRRQDHYVESLYQQTVKSLVHRAPWTFAEYYASYRDQATQRVDQRLNWHGLAEQWASAFGGANLIVRPYERSRFAGGSIFAEFLSLIGLTMDGSFVLPPAAKSNLGLPRELVELTRITNPTRDQRKQADFMKLLDEVMVDHLEGTGGHAYDYLSPEERVELLQEVEAGNRLVATEYLHREDGRLFLEPWPDPREPWEEPRLSFEEAVPWMAGLISRQQQEVESLTGSLDRARARAERLELLAAVSASVQAKRPARCLELLERWRSRRDVRLVAASGLFDRAYYVQAYPDVRHAGDDPVVHYTHHGWLEGRNPSPTFDTLAFLFENPDVLATGRCPLAVLAERGSRRGS